MSEIKLNTTGGSGGSVSLKGPASTTGNADVDFVLPQADGSAGQYLKTDGSKNLSFGTVSTAEQDSSTGDYTLTSGDLKFATDVKGIRFNGNSSTGYIIADTTGSNAIWTNVGGNLNSWSWRFGGTEKFTFNSTGNIAFASGNGIDFSATTHQAGMTSELLDAYEEGTWTPGLTYGGTAVGLDSPVGTYVKIGNFCCVRCRCKSTNNPANGNVSISGLPFVPSNPSGDGNAITGAVYMENCDSNTTSGHPVAFGFDNSSGFDVRYSGQTGGGTTVGSNTKTGTTFMLTLSYQTA